MISVSTIKKSVNKDVYRENVYSFDTVLSEKIKEKDGNFPKLFRELSKDSCLTKIAKNIADDFMFGNVPVSMNRSARFSTYCCGKIELTPSVMNCKNLEVLLHEFAHMLNAVFFPTEASHDGAFLAAFRFLLDYYDIISHEEFNKMVEKFPYDIQLFDDYIVSFDKVDLVELERVKNSIIKRENTKAIKTRHYGMMHSDLGTELIAGQNHKYIFCTNKELGKGFIVKLNYFNFEIENKYEKITIEELKNIMVLSPVASYDSYGFISRSKYTYIDPTFKVYDFSCVFKRENTYFAVEERIDCNSYQRSEVLKERTQYAKSLRKEGYKVIIANSEKEYDYILDILKNKYDTFQKETKLAAKKD